MLAGNAISSNANGEYAFIAGNVITINGNVSRDAFIAGQSILIEKNGVINRDLYVVGNDVVISGAINGNVYVLAQKLDVKDGASIRGNIKSRLGEIVIAEGASVLGNVEYNSDAISTIPETISTTVIEMDSKNEVYLPSFKEQATLKIVSIISSLLLFVLLLIFVPALFTKIDEKNEFAEFRIGRTLGFGFLALCFIPLFIIILMITIIGIPAAIVFLFMYIITLMITGVIAPYVISKMIWKEKMNKILGTVGIIVFALLKLVPVLGGLLYFISVLYTFGFILEVMRKRKEKTDEVISDNTNAGE